MEMMDRKILKRVHCHGGGGHLRRCGFFKDDEFKIPITEGRTLYLTFASRRIFQPVKVLRNIPFRVSRRPRLAIALILLHGRVGCCVWFGVSDQGDFYYSCLFFWYLCLLFVVVIFYRTRNFIVKDFFGPICFYVCIWATGDNFLQMTQWYSGIRVTDYVLWG